MADYEHRAVSETTTQTFTRWLSDGETWIGIFENHDLGHPDIGRRIALSFELSVIDMAEVGKQRAPDSKLGMGWRYILIGKALTTQEAIAMMDRKDVIVRNHGTLGSFQLLSKDAHKWVKENVQTENHSWAGDNMFVAEHRFVEDLVIGMRDAGLELELG